MSTVSHRIEPDDGPEVEVVLEYTATPFRAAQITGPPENCYPAEGGPEADSMSVDGKDIDMYSKEWTSLTERLLELAGEQMEQEAIDEDSAHGDWLYEQEKDRRLEETA